MQPKLFKETGNAEDFKKYLPVNVNTSFKTLSSYLGTVEQNYIQPLLGKSLFQTLVTMYENDTLTPEHAELLDLIKYSEIYLAYFTGWSILSISLSDSGANSKATEGNRLFRYQEENAEKHFKDMGFNQIDNTLDYIHEHIDIFDQFTESEFYKDAKKTLIPDTKTFNEIYNIQSSRLVFLKMRQYISIVEDIELRHFFGDDFINELLTADLSAVRYEMIVKYIRKYIVYMAIYRGIEELKKIPTEKGLIFKAIGRLSSEGYSEYPIETREIKETKENCKQLADSYLSMTIDHLNELYYEYPNYANWAGKNNPKSNIHFRENKRKKTFFFPIKT